MPPPFGPRSAKRGGILNNSARRRRKILRFSSGLYDGKHVKNAFSNVLGRPRRQKFSPAALKLLILVSFLLLKLPAAGEKKWVFWVFKKGLVNKKAPLSVPDL